MNTIIWSDEFATWLKGLKDRPARAKIAVRIKRAEAGNFGDCGHFAGIGEMRVDQGPGYRVYFAKEGDTVYILLHGGDKKSQAADIEKAKLIWARWKT